MPFQQQRGSRIQSHTTAIVIQDVRVKETTTGKKVYEFTADDGTKYQCWDKTIASLLSDVSEAEIKYYSKPVGRYENNTITAVKNAETGEWVEQEQRTFAKTPRATGASNGGPNAPLPPYDPIALIKTACLKTAGQVVSSYLGKAEKAESLALWVAHTVRVAGELERGYFSAPTTKEPKTIKENNAEEDVKQVAAA